MTKKKQTKQGTKYPVLCPMCHRKYYSWNVTRNRTYSYDGSYFRDIIAYIEYFHDDGLVCSRPWKNA